MIKAKPLPSPSLDQLQRLANRCVEDENGCWIVQNVMEREYSQIKVAGQDYQGHRIMLNVCQEEVTPNRVVDHTCRKRSCVNPRHLRQVSQRENSRANHQKCINGHPYVRPNLIEVGNKRKCMACELDKVKRGLERKGLQPGDTCPAGHVLTFDNVYQYQVNGSWSVMCAECQRERSRKYADAKPLPPMTSKQIRALTAKIEYATDGCWNWTGMIKKGYGRYVIDRSNYPVHRLMYQLEHGKLQQGFHIDHLCGNKRCCNPGHLEAVPPAINTKRATARRKGKTNWGKPWKKTDKPAPFAVPEGHLTVQQLADKLGTTTQKIQRMIEKRKLPSVKRGRLRYICWDDYVEWRKGRNVSLPAIEPDLTLFP